MPTDVKTIVGEDRMKPADKEHAIMQIGRLQLSARAKRFLFARWCHLVNCNVTLDDLDRIARWRA